MKKCDLGDRSYLKSGAGNSASITTSPWHQKKPSRRRRSGRQAAFNSGQAAAVRAGNDAAGGQGGVCRRDVVAREGG